MVVLGHLWMWMLLWFISMWKTGYSVHNDINMNAQQIDRTGECMVLHSIGIQYQLLQLYTVHSEMCHPLWHPN